jgi:hypothetical protein
VAELRAEAERRRSAELDEMRAQVSRLRDAAAEHARTAAAAAVAAEVARAKAVTAPAAQTRKPHYIPPPPRRSMPRFIVPLAASLVVIAVGGYTVTSVPAIHSLFSRTPAPAPIIETPAPEPAPEPTRKPAKRTPKEEKTGDLSVTAPAGARVILDGKLKGTAPLELQGLTAGPHALELQSPTGTIKRTIVVRAGSRFIADETMSPGYLSIVAKNPLEIYFGGKRIGTTEDEKIEMAPGSHTITLLNPRTGGRSELTVDIKSGEISAYSNTPATGHLVVNTAAGAEVFIEGESVGTAPLGELEVAVGTRTIVVRHPELGEKRVTMDIKRDQTTEITLPFGNAPADAPKPPGARLAPLSAQPAPRPTLR